MRNVFNYKIKIKEIKNFVISARQRGR